MKRTGQKIIIAGFAFLIIALIGFIVINIMTISDVGKYGYGYPKEFATTIQKALRIYIIFDSICLVLSIVAIVLFAIDIKGQNCMLPLTAILLSLSRSIGSSLIISAKKKYVPAGVNIFTTIGTILVFIVLALSIIALILLTTSYKCKSYVINIIAISLLAICSFLSSFLLDSSMVNVWLNSIPSFVVLIPFTLLCTGSAVILSNFDSNSTLKHSYISSSRSSAVNSDNNLSMEQKLEKLRAFHDRGLINDEDYSQKKQELLGRF